MSTVDTNAAGVAADDSKNVAAGTNENPFNLNTGVYSTDVSDSLNVSFPLPDGYGWTPVFDRFVSPYNGLNVWKLKYESILSDPNWENFLIRCSGTDYPTIEAWKEHYKDSSIGTYIDRTSEETMTFGANTYLSYSYGGSFPDARSFVLIVDGAYEFQLTAFNYANTKDAVAAILSNVTFTRK
ncbi:MAG: hypothetical protein LBD25_00020 [Coriobacteriales bacterium]|nr:hypothetical protein [Coriobacteriales bacterium]